MGPHAVSNPVYGLLGATRQAVVAQSLAVPASEIVRLVLPTGLVLKTGCSMRGVSTGVVAAAYTVCQREIMVRSLGV